MGRLAVPRVAGVLGGAVWGSRVVRGIKRMRYRGNSRRIGLIETLVDEEHLIGPRLKRRYPGLTAEIVLVEVRDVKEALETLNNFQRAFALDTVELDNQLVDAPQNVVGNRGEGFPLGSFDVDLQHDVVGAIAVL